MRKNNLVILSLISALLLSVTGCGREEKPEVTAQIESSQMKAICELAVMDCYYHNVAKYFEEDAEGILFWQRDKKFWIEYSGVVSIGFDTSLLQMEVDGSVVNITLPEAKILNTKVDENSLSEESFYVDKSSAAVTAEDQTAAFADAQAKMIEMASSDTALFAEAERRVEILLGKYVDKIGEMLETEYSIVFHYIENDTTKEVESGTEATKD